MCVCKIVVVSEINCWKLCLCVVVPITDYYIIAGIVYQAPDLISVINARLVRLWLSVKCVVKQNLCWLHPWV